MAQLAAGKAKQLGDQVQRLLQSSGGTESLSKPAVLQRNLIQCHWVQS